MVDDDTRRAQTAERVRRYRQRKRDEQAAAPTVPLASDVSAKPATGSGAAPASSGDVAAAGSVEADVAAAIGTMKQLAASDAAIVTLARRTARQIDSLLDNDPIANAARIFGGMNTLTRILHELGGTPTVRQQYEVRSRRLERKTTEGPDGGTAPAVGGRSGNVTTLRPPKRSRA